MQPQADCIHTLMHISIHAVLLTYRRHVCMCVFACVLAYVYVYVHVINCMGNWGELGRTA